jgi:serine/threonine protein kinase
VSQQIFKKKKTPDIRIREICENCHKPKIGATRKISLTALVMSSSNCQCKSEFLEKPRIISSETTSSGTACRSNQDHETSDDPPELDDAYGILDRIGSGGMGTVWKVFDRTLNLTLAVKVLRPDLASDPIAVQRFEQEARMATDLTHRNIAAVYGPGIDKVGRPYILMNYIDGISLAQHLAANGTLEPERAFDIFRQTCEALGHSHMKGIVHRDVKPANIILSKTETGADVVHVVDFGIAKSIYGDVRSSKALTLTEEVLGSPSYMSPEQCLGLAVTAQSDIYSIGCVLFEMLTGAPPFTEKNPIRLVIQHLSEPPDFSSIPFRFRTILDASLKKDSGARPKTIDDLLAHADTTTGSRSLDNPRLLLKVGSVVPGLLVLQTFSLHSSFVHNAFDLWILNAQILLLVSFCWVVIRYVRNYSVIFSNDIRRLEISLFTALAIIPFELLFFRWLPHNETLSFYSVFLPLFCLVFTLLQTSPLYDQIFNYRPRTQVESTVSQNSPRLLLGSFRFVVLFTLIVAAMFTVFTLLCLMNLSDIDTTEGPIVGFLTLLVLASGVALSWFTNLLEVGDCSNSRNLNSLQDSLKKCSVVYFVILFIVSLTVAMVWDPSLRFLLRQSVAPYTNLGTASRVPLEALSLPVDGTGVAARIKAASILLTGNGGNGALKSILYPIISGPTDQSNVAKACAYAYLARSVAVHEDWPHAIQYFDNSIQDLQLDDKWFYPDNPKEMVTRLMLVEHRNDCVIALAELACLHGDNSRAIRAIHLAKNFRSTLNDDQRGRLKTLELRYTNVP